MMSKFQAAGVAETLRSSQKDEYYLKRMRSHLAETIQGLLGVSHWLKWRLEYDSFSDLAYFLLTTVSGLQTLGEEYVHIIQVDSSLRKVPSVKRRLLSILLHVLGPLGLIYCQRYCERRLSSNTSVQSVADGNREQQLLKSLQAMFWIISLVSRLNLIAFYFNGGFYHVAKRLTGIKYILIRRWLAQFDAKKPFMILGLIAAVQLIASVFLDARKFHDAFMNASATENVDRYNKDENFDVMNQCSLCTEERKETTLTPCGHLFCWNCIISWLQTKEECPLCREGFGPSRLIYLQNYN